MIQPELDPGYHPLLSNPSIPVLATEDVRLREGFNTVPHLTACLRLDLEPERAAELLGTGLEWSVPVGTGRMLVFRGIVNHVSLRDDLVFLTAEGEGWKRARAWQTRSFATVMPTAISQLPGLESVLTGITNTEALKAQATHALQYQETEWDFLVRIAGFCGQALLSSLDGLQFTDARDVKPRPLPGSSLFAFGERLSLDLVATAAESRTWKPSEGTVEPGVSADALAESKDPWVKKLHARASAALGEGHRHQVFLDPFGAVLPDLDQAKRISERLVHDLLHWEAASIDPSWTVGQVVTLSQPPLNDSSLLIAGRILTYAPSRSPQLVNELQCRLHGFGVPIPASQGMPRGLSIHTGQVIDLVDPLKLGRIQVNLPWQARGGDEPPAGWEGVWCLIPQPFGGIDAGQRAYGIVNYPLIHDWVRVVLDPSGFGPPTVLGVVYRGASVPEALSDPKTERILLHTPGGLKIHAREAVGEGTASLTFALEPSANSRCRITLTSDGHVTIESGTSKVDLADKAITVSTTETTVSGKLHVRSGGGKKG